MTFVKFFFCEHDKQQMAKIVCTQRQKRASVVGPSKARSFAQCRACPQGREILREIETEKARIAADEV